MSRYVCHVYEGPAPGEDDLAAALWAAGTLGFAAHPAGDDRLRVEAWFAEDAEPPAVDVPGWVLESVEAVPERDWLAPWREQARPFEVGERFLLDPREPEGAEPVEPGSRILLRLPARRAFGVGSHETTRLILELLEEFPPDNARVLDVGTGTGVLALAARAQGARCVVAFDVDPVAAIQARDNARLNGFALHLFAGPVGALGPRARFDVILLNVIPELVRADLPAVAKHVASGGSVLVSGLLAEQASQVSEDWHALGFAESHRRRAGEWTALRLERKEGA